MGRIWVLALVLVCCVAVSIGGGERDGEGAAKQWEKTIGEFEEWDSKNSYPADAVLFVGSSSIRMWRTRESFSDLPVINRGFGGSQISDVNYFIERIVLKYRPLVIVFYAGDNDVAAGKSATRVVEDYRKFVAVVRERLPRTAIIYVGIKPSGSRWALWPVMAEANAMIRDLCDKDRMLLYFDSATPLLDAEGRRPDAKLFLNDQLHLNGEGYKIWTRLLRPIIDKSLRAAGSGRGIVAPSSLWDRSPGDKCRRRVNGWNGCRRDEWRRQLAVDFGGVRGYSCARANFRKAVTKRAVLR